MTNKRLLLIVAVLLIACVGLSAAVTGTFSERKNEILPVKKNLNLTAPVLEKARGVVYPLGTPDTLIWTDGGNSNFGGWTDDYFAEYFVPETDGKLHSITFDMSDLPDENGGGMAVWVYSSKYAWPEINTQAIKDGFTKGCHLGYYQTGTGKEAFGTPAEWVKGSINTYATGAIADKIYDPLGEQLTPFIGAMTVSLPPNANDGGFVTVDLDASQDTYEFEKGETLMVLIRFNGFPTGGDGTAYRMGFLSRAIAFEPQPGLKFYAQTANAEGRDGNAATDDWGWHIRSYIWDWRLNVEWTGDRPPVIASVTDKPAYLVTTPITIEAEITDDNPSGGTAGVASATLHYSIDGADYVDVTMTQGTGNVWSAQVPGQVPGTTVDYYITAVDVLGNAKDSWDYTYIIYEAVNPTLFVFDADHLSIGTAKTYYWYGADPDHKFTYDTWQADYGPLSVDLLNNYQVVVHVMGGGPVNQPDDLGAIYKAWMDGATATTPRKLFISGQDYGFISAFKDTTFPAGTFENDYLGIEKLGRQDVNYDETPASYQTPYRVDPVASSLSADYHAFQGDSVVLFYDPYNELGFSNWIDNLTPATGSVVDFTDPNHADSVVGIHKEGTNFKSVFWALDWLALSFYSPADTSSKYHWGLTDVGNLLGNVLTFLGEPVSSVSGEVTTPKTYALKQNFPNPFNPTTSIEYSLPEKGLVKLSIFNMLGQEVRTLVNTTQDANKYRVTWNGLDNNGSMVPSGIYFYTINANGFNATRKMVFMK